jgi:hypothetical protein
MGCGSACLDNFVLSILPTWNQNLFFAFARENSPVQPLILVEAGHKEEVASRLATEHRQLYSNVKLVDLREGATSTRWKGKPRAITLSNHLWFISATWLPNLQRAWRAHAFGTPTALRVLLAELAGWPQMICQEEQSLRVEMIRATATSSQRAPIELPELPIFNQRCNLFCIHFSGGGDNLK